MAQEQRQAAIAALLTATRRERRLTSRQAAHHFGVSQPTFSKWERGSALPGDDKLAAIAEWIGLPAPDVLAMKHDVAGATSVGDLLAEVSQLRHRVDALTVKADQLNAQVVINNEVLRALLDRLGPAYPSR